MIDEESDPAPVYQARFMTIYPPNPAQGRNPVPGNKTLRPGKDYKNWRRHDGHDQISASPGSYLLR